MMQQVFTKQNVDLELHILSAGFEKTSFLLDCRMKQHMHTAS
jgi:hypothetical protein